MKLKLQALLFSLLLTITATAQWTPKANFPGPSKAKSTAFTINNKIYVVGGVNNNSVPLNDFWIYDISANTWAQQSPFPGPERYGAVSFVINGKGYVATGANLNGFLDDLWEYDPATTTWIQKTGLPAGSAQHENQRREAYAFVIGNKAYLGGGDGFVFGPNSTSNIAFYDLWEYDPILDSWVPKADIPNFVGRDFSVGVAVNNKGYVGLGCNVQQSINNSTLWEYDPLSNSWLSKAALPSNYTVDASAFSLNGYMYLAGGVNLNPVSLSNQFYKYDPATNIWTALPNFPGGAIAGAFAISTGSVAFMGTGYNAGITTRNDLWEFTIPTGIAEGPSLIDAGVVIYPVPATESITLKVPSELSASVYFISDNLGRVVMDGQLTSAITSININALPQGIYYIKVGAQNYQASIFTKQ